MKINFFILVMLMSYFASFSQTAGTMTFTATTVNYSAAYSPKHILAIWIADNSGNWVKTRKFMASNPAYRQYLTNFKNATSSTYNATDAITGSTISNHNTGANNPQTVTWDGKNVSGTLVADGTYRVYIEFTSANATGKVYYCTFVKGLDEVNTTFANQTYFNNISLTWVPDLTGNEEKTSKEITVFPNPSEGIVNIDNAEGSEIELIDLSGKILLSKKIDANSESIDLEEYNPGKYFIKITKSGVSTVETVILL